MLSSDNTNLLRSGFELGKGGKLFQDIEREILKLVFWQENVTQSRIVEATRTPQQTVSRLVKSLLERNVLTQSDKLYPSNRGKPGLVLTPNSQYAYTFGVSILLDAIAVALMDFQGKVITSRLQIMNNMDIDTVLLQTQQMVQDITQECQVPQERVLGLGVGISGFFSSMDGKMNTHHTLEEWAQIDIAAMMTERFSLPCWVVNDGTGAAAGEGIAGVGRGYKNFVYLFISSAFGGGLINNTEMLRGTFGNAGELGDMLPPKLYSHPNLELLRRILLKNGVHISSIYDMNENFDINWPGVEEWVFKVQDSLDLVATCCSALLDTQAIIIGGHIPKVLAEKLIPRIDIYAQFRRGAKRPLPEVVTAGVQQNPVAVGAATLPLRELCL